MEKLKKANDYLFTFLIFRVMRSTARLSFLCAWVVRRAIIEILLKKYEITLIFVFKNSVLLSSYSCTLRFSTHFFTRISLFFQFFEINNDALQKF